jgi:hypothetical protein
VFRDVRETLATNPSEPPIPARSTIDAGQLKALSRINLGVIDVDDTNRGALRPARQLSRQQYEAIRARERAAREAAEAQDRPSDSVGHPGFAESLIPVWGSGRGAIADAQEGDYLGAAVNGALAASDLLLAKSIAEGVGKGAFYVTRNAARNPYDWDRYVRPWLGDERGMLAPRQHGHHWAIPQGGWGKTVPDWIKNQPWNIKPMPDAVTHWRIDHRVGSLPRFNPLERYWHGTPTWSKVAAADALGHPIAAATAGRDRR